MARSVCCAEKVRGVRSREGGAQVPLPVASVSALTSGRAGAGVGASPLQRAAMGAEEELV